MASISSKPTKLSQTISVYPPISDSNATSPSPKLIVLTAWVGASQRAIDRYVSNYQTRFPSAKVYTIKTIWSDFVYKSYDSIRKSLSPLVDVLKATDPHDILIATYSNGGMLKTSLLAEAYLSSVGEPLSPHVMLMDSCPDKESVPRRVHAASLGFPRLFLLYYPLLVATYAFLGGQAAWNWTSGIEDLIARSARIVNDSQVIGKEVPRRYIFSKDDSIVRWEDVIEHVREAEGKGLDAKTEEFDGSEHVQHMRMDGERYWRIVKELWEGRGDRRPAGKL